MYPVGHVKDFPGIMYSRALKPEDPEGTWCNTCLFIRRGRRKKGLTSYLIKSSLKAARKAGAKSAEAYHAGGGTTAAIRPFIMASSQHTRNLVSFQFVQDEN